MVDYRWADPMDAYDKANERVNALFDNAAQKQAGDAFAKGDYAGAAGVLAKRGKLAEAGQITDYGQKQTDSAQAHADDASRRVGVKALANNDYTGAKTAFAQGGDLAGVTGAQTAAAQQFQQQHAYQAQALPVLDAAYQKGGAPALAQATAQLAHDMKALHYSDDEIAQYQQTAQADPQAFLSALHVGVKTEYEFRTAGDETQVLDKSTGKMVGRYVGTKFLAAKPEEDIVKVGGTGGPMTGGAASPAAQPQADPAAPTGAPATLPAPAQPMASGPVADKIRAQAKAAGVDPEMAVRVAQAESSLNPTAANGSSRGVYQFQPDAWREAGGVPGQELNADANISLGVKRLAGLTTQLKATLGRDPTPGEVYMLHQQGPTGGMALLTAPPEVSAVQALMGAGVSKPKALASIVRNGGTPTMSAGDFVNKWTSKIGGAPGSTQAPAPTAAPAQPDTGYEMVRKGTPKAEDGDTPLTPEAIQMMGAKWVANGTIPQLGGGKYAAANKIAVLNAGTAIAKSLGLDANDLVAGNASIKALGSALNKATTMRTQVEGSENTVEKNLTYALSLAPKGVGNGPPVWNRFEQFIRKDYIGDPQVSQFDGALHTAAEEYAKVMTTTTGAGGVSSDSARQEAYRRLSTSATLDQLQANAAAMRVEMKNRIDSLREVETGIRQNIRAGGRGDANPPAGDAPATAPAPTQPAPRGTGGGSAFTDQQKAYEKAAGPAKGAPGSATKPYYFRAATADQQYANLPKGAHYVGPDGQMRVK